MVQTPGQLAKRGELYHQLGQMTGAGIGLLKGIEIQRRSPPAQNFRRPLSVILEHLGQGASFSDSVRHTGDWMPEFDRALLDAGERSGRLPACFQMLAEHYAERSRLAKQLLSDCAYPFFLFHFAIFIGPFPDLFLNHNLMAYLGKTFGVLIPVYAVVAVILFATRDEHGERWRSVMESLLSAVPVIGSARRNLALARLCACLEALISAGVTIVEAWDLAAAASGSPLFKREVAGLKPLILAGQTPAEAVSRSSAFPETFTHLYSTGEVTGQLDESLRRLQKMYQEEASRKLKAFSQWLPKIVYFAIVIMIAYRVISFYQGYFKKIDDVMKF
jgi:type II secretory pathway component PulF